MSNGCLLINKPKSVAASCIRVQVFCGSTSLQWKFIKSFGDFTRVEKARAMVGVVLQGSYFQNEMGGYEKPEKVK